MHFEYLLLDLDNTLYDYSHCHEESVKTVFKFLSPISHKSIIELQSLYQCINQEIKNELGYTASSHNKLIYFKKLMDNLRLDKSIFLTCQEKYWDTFYQYMSCFDGVLHCISWLKKQHIKIAVVTDYETEYQIKKLQLLNLLEFIDVIVTSEEIGKEKPSSHIFLFALHKLNATPNKTIMIGDNYDKDIVGAMNVNITPFWYSTSNHTYPGVFSFSSWTQLHNHFMKINDDLLRLKYISKYCGERFDLTQASGGNVSVKNDNFMFIKASGYLLTNVTNKNGFVTIDHHTLNDDIQKQQEKSIDKYTYLTSLKGSIETFMHSILKKYTIHLHPIQINQILISKSCDRFLNQYFPNSLIIDYCTPGIDVCTRILPSYNNQEIIFLKNHGIIVTVDEYDTLLPCLEKTLSIFETKLNMDLHKYKLVNQISKTVNEHYEFVSYLCEDTLVCNYLLNKKELFFEKITFPDALIFCGEEVVFINTLQELCDYCKIRNLIPKIVVMKNLIYMIHFSLQKCRDTEAVFKSNLMILDTNFKKTYLTADEICYLNNWDAEKYRQQII